MKLLDRILGVKREPACTPERAAEIFAKCAAEQAEEDRLYYKWARGPGRDYPKETRMMAMVSGAPLKPTEVWKDGWMEEFERYKVKYWSLTK